MVLHNLDRRELMIDESSTNHSNLQLFNVLRAMPYGRAESDALDVLSFAEATILELPSFRAAGIRVVYRPTWLFQRALQVDSVRSIAPPESDLEGADVV